MALAALDIGTSGVKGLAIKRDGAVIADATREYPLLTPKPGWAEQDPEAWWAATIDVLRELQAKCAESREKVDALGLTGQMHGAVFLDAAGQSIRPSILWCDQRTQAECDELTRKVGEQPLRRITANPALTGFQAPKILWLRNNEQDSYTRIRHVVLPKDYIRYRLTGEFFTDVSDASGTTLFDVPKRRWSSQILDDLDLPAQWFPESVESPMHAGTVSSAGERETGLRMGTPICGGGGDQAAGAVGAGIVRPGVVSSTVGTSGVVFAFADEPWTDPEGRIHTFCHAVPKAWHVMGVMLSAGGSLRWIRDTLGYASYAEMNADASKTPAGSEGLVFLPYLSGERTPHRDAAARGVFFGLSLSHTRAHLVRAVMEGVAYGLNDSFRIFRELGVPLKQVRALGGGARSDVWLQMQADVTGLPHNRLNVDEGPAYGAAVLAGVMHGDFGSVPKATDSFVRTTSSVEPNAANRRVYEDGYEVFRSLYEDVKADFPRLSALGG